jgi:urease accessory protein
VRIDLASDGEAMGWDLLALGLAEAGQPFSRGRFEQHLELPDAWIERGRIHASDDRLLRSQLGMAGHAVTGTLWFLAGSAIDEGRRDRLLDVARALVEAHTLALTAGATSPHPRVVVLRVLAPRIEPAMSLFAAVRAAWRHEAWGLAANTPRVWAT